MKDFQNVFDAHPQVDTIYVVDGMPFLKQTHADSHARVTNKSVEIIARPVIAIPEAPLPALPPAKTIQGKGKKAETADAAKPVASTDDKPADPETETKEDGTAASTGGGEDVIMQDKK